MSDDLREQLRALRQGFRVSSGISIDRDEAMEVLQASAQRIAELEAEVERLREQKNNACLDRDGKWARANRAEAENAELREARGAVLNVLPHFPNPANDLQRLVNIARGLLETEINEAALTPKGDDDG